MDFEIKKGLKEKYSSHVPDNLNIRSLAIVDPGVEGDNWRDFSKWKVVREIK